MSIRIRTATVLAALTAATLTGAGAAGASSAGTGDAAPVAASTESSGWPAELTENTRLFVNPYRSYLVQERNGVPTLVLSTGWDSCYFMTQHGQQRYPC